MESGNINVDELIQEVASQIKADRSSASGLSYNPFPVSGISGTGDSPVLPPIAHEARAQVREFLSVALSSQKFVGLTVVGDYGLGKTHVLRWIEHIVNATRTKLGDRLIRAYYVSNPRGRPIDVLMAVTGAIGEEEFRKMLWSIVAQNIREQYKAGGTRAVRSMFQAENTNYGLLIADDKAVEELVDPDALTSLPQFRAAFSRTMLPPVALRVFVEKSLTEVPINRDVARAFVSMLLDDDIRAFSSWVSLTSSEAQKPVRVPQEDYFRSILAVLKRNGIGPVLLLIDEFEDVAGLRLTPRQRAEYLATLRLLIDAHIDDFGLVLALAPEAWTVTIETYSALSDRLGRRVDLRPLSREHATELVTNYLAVARGSKSVDDPIAPFTQEAIAALVRRSKGNTRAFLSACYQVLHRNWESEVIDETLVGASTSI